MRTASRPSPAGSGAGRRPRVDTMPTATKPCVVPFGAVYVSRVSPAGNSGSRTAGGSAYVRTSECPNRVRIGRGCRRMACSMLTLLG
ncbi:hypothetical protein GCM10027610_078510 [Dactylosporangium cerinum]